MDYDQMAELWDGLSGSDVDGARKALLAFKVALEFEGKPGKKLLAGTGAEHVLIAWAWDQEGAFILHVVPVELVDEPLRAALVAIDGRVFAGGADLDQAQWDAAVLVMSALAFEMRDAEAMVGWAVDDGTTVDPDVIRAAWNRWKGSSVAEWKELDRKVTAVYTFRRAM